MTYGFEALTHLVTLRELLREKAIGLARDPRVSDVTEDIDLRRYVEANDATGWLDATLRTGETVSWLFDLRWTTARWEITARVEYRPRAGDDAEVLARLSDAGGTGDEDVSRFPLDTARQLTGHTLDDILPLAQKLGRDDLGAKSGSG